jgi:mannosyl-3-phosphoglycerate phosphatase family protein
MKSARYAIFTDIDGTRLDAARSTVKRLQSAGIPIVPVTSMTLDEMAPIADELELRSPMIIESGGAIARWGPTGWEIEPCGPDADTLLEVIREIEDRSGADLTVYSALAPDEAARLSGLSGERLLRSTQRRFSEPFVVTRGDAAGVVQAATAIGFCIRRSRGFLHLCRQCDEGEAFTRLHRELRCDVAVALGDSPLDAEFLNRAEIAIIIPRADGTPDPELLSEVPNARIARLPGAAGWAAAIEELWPQIVSAPAAR